MISREKREAARVMWSHMAPARDVGAAIGASVSAVYKMARQFKWPKRKRTSGGVMEMCTLDPTPEEIAARAAAIRERHIAERRALR